MVSHDADLRGNFAVQSMEITSNKKERARGMVAVYVERADTRLHLVATQKFSFSIYNKPPPPL